LEEDLGYPLQQRLHRATAWQLQFDAILVRHDPYRELLRAEHADDVINAGALDYMAAHGLAQQKLAILEAHGGRFVTQAHLEARGITGTSHVTIATEGALMGRLLAQSFPATKSIISDDAGQFNVFDHALCWIHAERASNRLIPLNDPHRKALAWVHALR
jgi:hypothetical protein